MTLPEFCGDGDPVKSREAIGDERRATLVRAAYDIIAAQGFEGLRTRDIAARVGINVATLHYYFPTKEALIKAVAAYLSAQFQSVRGSVARGGTARDRLRQEFADGQHYLRERPDMIAVAHELSLRGRRDPAIREVIVAMTREWRGKLEELIADGIREGAFHAAIEPRVAASMVAATLWSSGTLPLEPGELDAVGQAVDRWLAGSDAPPAGSGAPRGRRSRWCRP